MQRATVLEEAKRDEHIRQMIEWHFSPDAGSPFWLSQMDELGFDPREKVKGFGDLVEHFPNFDGDKHLRTVSADQWIPTGFTEAQRWSMFVTGGTTGDPKRRLGRRGMERGESDIADDYHAFAKHLSAGGGFPQGGKWLYIGPGGPRRLKRGVEVLSNVHESVFIEIDMDVAWMKSGNNTLKGPYKRELVERAIGALRRDRPDKVFCPPILIMAIGELFDWSESGVTGVFAGGTEMSPETVRFIHEELFRGKVHFAPTYGNALVGIAPNRPYSTFDRPIAGQDPYQVIYQPLQPQTLLRVTKKGDSQSLVEYGEFGYVEITTVTKSWFMPRFLERDYAKRIAPTEEFPWDGLAEIQPPPELKGKLSTGVY
ncbi:hypothetical protein COU75_01220 [Candidatus Peregrinibacteria bacterium CG10_big_fil_rev_8_21_14_0_10_42_8]|nr:MAG: hypothetical protein COU75_01220 [Candidatus Peregrinibacteria bacterium CG10_big_fil_rev_8_21_14_0_10_42_8]